MSLNDGTWKIARISDDSHILLEMIHISNQ